MSQEIGVAYVSLLPSGKGFSKGVQSEAESAFKGAEKSSDGFFSGVTKWAKRGAVVVGGMVSAVGALALGGGISRALNIEDATAKLKGLGHDTQSVEAIMKDALASVKGTAFGLDAAATTAASAVAAGIKPGQELERYLRLTADAATIAGVSMEEMGSIINQVTSKGYAGMENLNRLTERGIPIMQWLADEYGVTADELSKMVSRGEVDSATFRKVIEDNIGGAALESGNTTRGAFANMLASLSRLGEGFAGPALGAARDFFNEITKITDGIKSQLAPAFGDLQYAVDGLDFKFSDDILASLTPILDTINEISAAAREGSLSQWFRDAARFSPGLSIVLGVMTALAPLIPVVQVLADRIGPALGTAFSELAKAITPLIPMIADSLSRAIIEIAPPLTDLLIAILPLIPPLLELVTILLPALTFLIAGLAPIISGVADVLTQWLDAMMVLHEFINGDVTLDDLYRRVAALTGPIGEVTLAFINMVGFISTSVSSLQQILNGAWSQIGAAFSRVSQTILGIASSIWAQVPAQFRVGVSNALAILGALPANIQRIMAGVGGWLVGSGRALMQGFVDGINSMIGRVGSSITSVLSWAQGFFPHSPALRGPFSGSGWTDVYDGGQSLMEQFAFGAEKFKPQLSFASFLTQSVSGSLAGVSMPSELVVRDVNNQLIGRMAVEASELDAQRGSRVTQAVRNGRWDDA